MLSKRALLNDRASRFEPAFSQPWRYNEMLADNILQTTALSWDNWQLDLKKCKVSSMVLQRHTVQTFCMMIGLFITWSQRYSVKFQAIFLLVGPSFVWMQNTCIVINFAASFFFFFWQSTNSGAKMRKRSFMQHQSPWACWKCDGNFSLFLETKETYIMHSKVTFECILHTAWLLRCPFWQNSLSKFRTKKLIL